MRIAFCGKGGSGKTTLASVFIRWLLAQGKEVLAIDGDINQHLGAAIGLRPETEKSLNKLGNDQLFLKEFVRGTNPRIAALDHISESMPPGRGSRFIKFGDRANPVLSRYGLMEGNLTFISIGGHSKEDVAATCYHRYTGAEGIFLNHLIDGPNEYVVGDMVAGADPFASSGIASRYDVIILVVEPTVKSVAVFNQAQEYLRPFGLTVKVVGNKIMNEADVDFIKTRVGENWLGAFESSEFIRRLDRGEQLDISHLEPANAEILKTLKGLLDCAPRDWEQYLRVGIQYHEIVAKSWGEKWLGVNPMTQIDPEFSYELVLAGNGANVAW